MTCRTTHHAACDCREAAVERLARAAERAFDGFHDEGYPHPSECGTRMGGLCDCWVVELRAALAEVRPK